MAKALIIASHSGAGRTSTANTTEYYPIIGIPQLTTTETVSHVLLRTGGTLSKFCLRITANSLSGGNLTLRLRKNTANGNQVLTITAGATGLFEDLSNTDSVAAGDKVNIQSVPPATGTYSFFDLSFVFDSSNATETVTRLGPLRGNDTIALDSTTTFYPLSGSPTFTTAATTETEVRCLQRVAGTFRNMCVNVTSNARVSSTTFRARKNGANGNMVVSVGAGVTGFLEDVANTDAVVVGDDYNFSIATGAGAGEVLLATGIAVDFVTTDGKSQCVKATPAAAGPTAVADGQTRYECIGGSFSAMVSDETQVQITAREQFVFSQLVIRIIQNNVTQASTLFFRINTADTALAASITASTTGTFSDTVDNVTTVSTDLVSTGLTVPLIGGPETITPQWISVWTSLEAAPPGVGSGLRSNINTIPRLSFPGHMDALIPQIRSQRQNVRTL